METSQGPGSRPLFAGVDGGQSSTTAVIGDARGELGRGVGEAADLVGTARESDRRERAVSTALRRAFEAAGLATTTPLAALVAGLSGFDPVEVAPPKLGGFAGRVRIVHDAEIAHAGALGGGPGIVVVAGTGSVALGIDSVGRAVRTGGWGYLFGDAGSAFALGRAAIGAAMAAADRGERSALGEAALAALAQPSLRAVQHAWAHGDVDRVSIASFARTVLAHAAAGALEAIRLRSAAAAELAALVAVVDRRLGRDAVPPLARRPVSFAGGLFDDPGFAHEFRLAVIAEDPHVLVVPPRGDAAAGALSLARKLR